MSAYCPTLKAMRSSGLRRLTSTAKTAAVIASTVSGMPAVSSSAMANVEDVVISPSRP